MLAIELTLIVLALVLEQALLLSLPLQYVCKQSKRIALESLVALFIEMQ